MHKHLLLTIVGFMVAAASYAQFYNPTLEKYYKKPKRVTISKPRNSVRPSGKPAIRLLYVPGEEFPTECYKIFDLDYPKIESCDVCRFPDNDSVYYIKVIKEDMEKHTCFFMLLTAADTQTFLDHTLNSSTRTTAERQQWYTNFMDDTKISNTGFTAKGNKYWTYYRYKPTFRTVSTAGGYGHVADPSSAAYGPMDFESARQTYYQQNGMDENGNKIPEEKIIASYMLLLKGIALFGGGTEYTEDEKNALGIK